MIPYAELTNESIGYLEIDSTDLDRYQVVESLNAAQLELLNILPIKFISNVVKSTNFHLQQNVVAYQWPNDWLRFLMAWVDYDAAIDVDNRGTELTIWIADNFQVPMSEIATASYPFIDIEIEGGYEIRPKPSANMSNGGRLRYVWKPMPIDASQPSLLNYNLKNLLIYKAVELSAMVDNYRPDLSKKFGEFYIRELNNFMPKKEKT